MLKSKKIEKIIKQSEETRLAYIEGYLKSMVHRIDFAINKTEEETNKELNYELLEFTLIITKVKLLKLLKDYYEN